MKASKENPIYSVYIIVKNTKYDITPAVISIDLSDQASEMAQSATISVMNVKVGGVLLTNQLKSRCRVFIYADDGSKKAEVLRGCIWGRKYNSSLTDREVTLRCYDDLKYFLESEDADYFSAGKTTEDVMKTLCKKWGVELDYQYKSITHAKLALRGTLGDIVTDDLLDQVKKQTGENYVFLQTEGKFIVRGIGKNSEIYTFRAGENTISTTTDVTMKDMVTKVIIYGKTEGEDTRAPVEAIETGNTEEYGTMQKIITRDENTSLEEAKQVARNMINSDGEPTWEYHLKAADIPWIRKGDKVYINAGDIQDKYLIVDSIDRSISNNMKNMDLTLSVDGRAIGGSSVDAEDEAAKRQKVADAMTGWIGNGSHKEILDIYNGQSDLPRDYELSADEPWCAAAVSAALIEAGIDAPTECECDAMIDAYKAIGRWTEDDSYRPDVGDIIMFNYEDGGSGDNQGSADHAGIVVAVSGNTMTIIDGNNRNGVVGYTNLEINGKGIRGYCLPDYTSRK